MFGRRAGGRVCASTAQEQAGQRQTKQASRRVELADGEEAHLDAALVDHGRPAPDVDGEQDVVIDRDALEAHGAERRRPGEEVGAGAARARAARAGGEEAHQEAALVDHRRPARDADGERGVEVDRGAVVAHAAELQAGAEVGAGAARRRAELLGCCGRTGDVGCGEMTTWMMVGKGSQ